MLIYIRVFGTFLRNALIREMMFKANFLIQIVTRGLWFFAQVALFQIIYREVNYISGWTQDQFFAFMATGMLINGIVETFFMPNCANLSEQIRTGRLDFALVKPLDTQFMVSLERVNLAMLGQIALALALLGTSLSNMSTPISVTQLLLYGFYVAVGVVFFYSMMIVTACTSIYLGRNQGLYDFWFYITVFARYPRGIYDRTGDTNDSRFDAGEMLQFGFSYLMPILLVVTVPARMITGTLEQKSWAVIALCGAIAGIVISRFVFRFSMNHYRSASS